MTAALTVSLPAPPPSEGPNHSRGMHWGKRVRSLHGYQLVCLTLLNAAKVKSGHSFPLGPCRLKIEYIICRQGSGQYMPHDADNALASCKKAIDCLKHAGIVIDDAYKHLGIEIKITRHLAIDRAGVKKTREHIESCTGTRVVFTLEEIEENNGNPH